MLAGWNKHLREALCALVQYGEDAQQDCPRFRWTTAHDGIDRQNCRHRPDNPIAAGKDAAIMRTVTDSDNHFRSGCRIIGAFERVGHVARHRTGDEQTIGMAR